MNIKRGEIYLAALDPVMGREIAKTRPVAVVSNDKNNEFSGTVTILPLTSKNPQTVYPFEVFISRGIANLPKDSKIKADQIRTLDKSRIIKIIGVLDKKDLDAIDKAIKIHLALLLILRHSFMGIPMPVLGNYFVQLVNSVEMPVPCKKCAADVHTGCGNPYIIDGDFCSLFNERQHDCGVFPGHIFINIDNADVQMRNKLK